MSRPVMAVETIKESWPIEDPAMRGRTRLWFHPRGVSYKLQFKQLECWNNGVLDYWV